MNNTDDLKFICKSRDNKIAYYTDGDFMYAEKDGSSFRLAVFDNGFYRLRLWKGIPILEIDGIRMHLVKDFKTPLDYSKQVVGRLKISKNHCVLDTCMGLGYIAIEAGKHAKEVTTCEISDAVYTLASWNPFSESLFTDKKYRILRGDISEEVKKFPNGYFDVIIHDPPRFSKAGQLYSGIFYHELFRILKPGGRIYHYVGTIGKHKGRSIEKEVEARLRSVGFGRIRYDKMLQGLFAYKGN